MLEIQNLSKTYGNGVKALDGLNLTVSSGMFGLLGPNGAGKSSFMRTLAGLQLPDTGSIDFDGINVLQAPDSLRRRLGYLPQYFGAYPFISCRALLRHMAVLKGLPDDKKTGMRIEQLLEVTNLSNHAGRAVNKFSGGMRQRFGIAQALLGEPDLLILDEPTAGLDPVERLNLYNLLSQLSADRIVILSTHIVDDVEQLCPSLAMICNGRITAQGATDTLISSLSGKVWQGQGKAAPHSALLSSSYKRGVAVHRYLSPSSPGPDYQAVQPTLQDAYFHQLKTNQEVAP